MLFSSSTASPSSSAPSRCRPGAGRRHRRRRGRARRRAARAGGRDRVPLRTAGVHPRRTVLLGDNEMIAFVRAYDLVQGGPGRRRCDQHRGARNPRGEASRWLFGRDAGRLFDRPQALRWPVVHRARPQVARFLQSRHLTTGTEVTPGFFIGERPMFEIEPILWLQAHGNAALTWLIRGERARQGRACRRCCWC